MKTRPCLIFSIFSLTVGALGQQTPPPSTWSAEYFPSEKGPHHTRWTRLSIITNELGIVSLHTNEFFQLRAGMNHWTGTEWTDSAPELILTNNGVLGRGAQHSAFFSSDLAGTIHNVDNMIAIPEPLNTKLNNFYQTKNPLTGGLSPRDWLVGKTLQQNYDFGRAALYYVGNGVW